MAVKGSGYLGSPSLQVSKANQEIITSSPSHWTQGYRLYKFSFSNQEDVTVVINKETTIFLEAGQGFQIDQGDAPIHSFVVVESGKSFNWIGAY